MSEYLSIREVAEKWCVKERRVRQLCFEGRIKGVKKWGNSWQIPDSAEKPRDKRVKSGNYIKK